jgi:diguanylate cyclase
MYTVDERDVNVLKVVLPLMSHHAAGYHPISYTVWYEYAMGGNAALRTQIDEEIAREPRLSVSMTYALYVTHLVEPAQQALLSARSGLLDTVGRIQHAVHEVDQHAERFEEHLDRFHQGVAGTPATGALGAQAASMLEASRELATRFRAFHESMDRSRDEVRRLTDELYRLRNDAQTDALSGLLNRRGFERALERLAPGDRAPPGGLAIVMIDIDGFKKVNDSYGHPLGDVVIAAVGRSINECVGGAGIAARYGGDEFVVLLPGQSPEQARQMAESIRVRVEQGKIRRRQKDDAIGGVTVSAGMATWGPGDDFIALIDRVDRALYASKRAGRNRVTVGG